MNVDFFDSINIPLPQEAIYARLCFSKGKTQVSDEQKRKFQGYIEEAQGLINLRGAAVRISLLELDSPKIILSEGIIFKSKPLSKLLADCKEVLFMAATAGSKITEAISKKSRGKDVTRAVIFDAVASEMADTALNWITNYFNHRLIRENKQFTKRRFSAGYADFSLDNQKIMYETLKLKDLGVSLTKTNIFVPEKTVTAVVGILDKK